MEKSEIKVSPMMLQWQSCKEAAGEALLLFRMGDFYEAFYQDAKTLADTLDLTLTRRQDIPMSGVPYHTAETYIDRLIDKGYRVAVAEQTEDPKKAKGLVKREVVRIITPGTVINSSLLKEKKNNFFCAVTHVGALFGLSLIDLTTSSFFVLEFEKMEEMLNEVYRLKPQEFLTSKKFLNKHPNFFPTLKKEYHFLINEEEDWHFEYQSCLNFLTQHFKVHSLDGFGLRGMTAGINAAGFLLQYLQNNLSLPIQHVTEIHTYHTSHFMSLDRVTEKNLEITEPLNEGSKNQTLLAILDHTATPMGGRALREWIKHPLLSVQMIKNRQQAIQSYLNKHPVMESLKPLFLEVSDLERLMMKIQSGYANPRDLIALKNSFLPISRIKNLLKVLKDSDLIVENEESIQPLPDLIRMIEEALLDEPSFKLNEGNIFREGYHQELDELRSIKQDSHSWLSNYQMLIREKTGIKTLKVGYNRLSGYYIEVSKGQVDKMPDFFNRRQTLTNAERYITPELKNFESKVLTAEERVIALENELFLKLREEVAKYSKMVMRSAKAIGQLDALLALAEVAKKYHYICPEVNEGADLKIKNGRHPVVEAFNPLEKFTPNDTYLNNEDQRLALITGPNMAGKSTYIRQVALLVIMAQMGSFIPAESAEIGFIDKVFTRIGASDDLSRGQSTFMVEMTETANILHNATSRSLVILDEIGRGTSTYDGISIAWAVAEELLSPFKTIKTLFATHYWELTKLEEKVKGAINYNVAVHESQDSIIFLRKIVRGGTDKSYGIHVASLAGIPSHVILRAKEILQHLEDNSNRKNVFEPSKLKRLSHKAPTASHQMTFFNL
jgi:DNA mismatch repair protein MutS